MQRVLFFILGILLFTAHPISASETDSNYEKLNAYQKQYFEWTQQNFGQILETEDYSALSDSTKNELGLHWLNKLQELLPNQNTGGGYKKEDTQKWEAINTLAGLRYQRAIPALLQVATENTAKDNRERWMAVRALGQMDDASVVPNLIPLVYHYNMNTRIWAQIALVQLTGQNFGYASNEWCEWWNGQNREPKCPAEKVHWILPPDADPQWNDPEFQIAKDKEQLTIADVSDKQTAEPKKEIQIPPRDVNTPANLVDLTSFYNHSLIGSWLPMSRWPNEIQKLNYDLGSLPAGLHTWGGVSFDVRGIIQLSSEAMKQFGGNYPEKVEGISIQRDFEKLHVINSNIWGAGAPDGEIVAHLVLHYADGAQEKLDMVSGEHTQDWWYYTRIGNNTQAETAWRGTNEFVKSDFIRNQYGEIELRLFKATWSNPHPEKTVQSLDFVSEMGLAAPFIVALTVE